MAKFLITGVGGFIGSHLARACLSRGDEVVGIDDFSAGSPDAVADLVGLQLRRGNILDAALCAQALRGVEVVLHHAAIASVPRCQAAPAQSHAVNAVATAQLIDLCEAAGVRRFIFASSSAVYGNRNAPPLHEKMPVDPLSPYAEHKLLGEQALRRAQARGRLQGTVLRYFNVYGPGQRADSGYAAAIPRFVAAALAKRPPQVHGDGEQSRDFTLVDDVVRANLMAATHPAAAGQTFNIAGGQNISLQQLLVTLGDIVGRPLSPTYGPALPGEVRHSCANAERAAQLLGYRARASLKAGLAATVHAALQARRQAVKSPPSQNTLQRGL